MACVQMASSASRGENLQRIQTFIQEAPKADLLVFPEYACCLGSTAEVLSAIRHIDVIDEELGGMARNASRTVCFGGVGISDGEDSYNSLLVYDASGQRIARYDKIHLFPSPQAPLDEGAIFRRGEHVVTLQLHDWKIGLSICFDLRFPELYREMAEPDVLICPSAFTFSTGLAHWHTLAMARAIENTAYFVAADQCAEGRFAHSIAVDPWGKILHDAQTEECVFTVTMKKQRIAAVRKLMPSLDYRCIE